MYMSVNLIAFYRCCNEDRDVLSKQSNKYCISPELCDGPRVQFLMPLSFPQEFLNWICTCSLSLRRCSIRFLDDWWTRFIGSQLLYSQRDNWITLWGNWLLCYGMHHGKLSNLPGARKPPNWDQISCCSDEKFDDWCCHYRKWLSFLITPHHRLAIESVAVWIIVNPGSGSSMIWQSDHVCWHRKPRGRDFKTLWSIIAFVSGIIAQCAAS